VPPGSFETGAKIPGCPTRKEKCTVIGTMRRECLDFMIPFSDRHLRRVLSEWVAHYNLARPHRSLGPGLPVPEPTPVVLPKTNRHQLPQGWRVAKRSSAAACTMNIGWRKRPKWRNQSGNDVHSSPSPLAWQMTADPVVPCYMSCDGRHQV
jgi:Integrase core domain